jgi:polar amino acid transport system permease protein
VTPLDELGDRNSRILGGRATGPVRNVTIAVVSTVVVFGVLIYLVTSAPGWDAVKQDFFNWQEVKDGWRDVAHAFLLNIKMFMVAEPLILVFAMLLAVLRSLPGPVFFPLRLMAIVYTDLFRGVPTILVVYLLGFGVPGLGLSGVPTSPVFWGVVALVLVYTAYVAEVYRAGIESVHPSQEAAARSLGLSRLAALRYVILPQAVRRVIPPLLNDFIGLQKDTALVSIVGPLEALQAANLQSQSDFNYTPYLIAAFFFIVITIPLARFTDWLVARDRKRQQTGRLA